MEKKSITIDNGNSKVIKVLIAEDDSYKLNDVMNFLKSLGIHGPAIDTKDNVADSLRTLRSTKYDILILDLNLPLRDGEQPTQDGGKKILYSLPNERYLTPTYVMGLTQFDSYKDNFNEDFKEYDINIYNYNIDQWKSVLDNRISWIKKEKSYVHDRSGNQKIILLTHGIMTQGKWMDLVEDCFGKHGIKVIRFRYPHFSALKIISPWFRKKALSAYSKFIEDIFIKNPQCELSFISHSFGTYMTIKSLATSDITYQPNISNIILCGSVLRCDFDMMQIINKFEPDNIINDCSINDLALLLCNCSCYGLGNAGRIGFNGYSERLINRFFKGGHSSFFFLDKIENNWLPVIIDGDVQKIDERDFSSFRENLESVISMTSPLIKLVLTFTTIYLLVKLIKMVILLF